MKGKKLNLGSGIRKKRSEKFKKYNIESFLDENINWNVMPFKVTIVYALVGGVWILFSDRILHIFIQSSDTTLFIQTIKGWLFVIITSLLIYFLIKGFAKKNKYWSHKLKENYEELQATYEQLIAAEEELRAQYDELQEKQEIIRNSEERYKLALEGANDAIWEIDFITKEFFASDKFEEITGSEKKSTYSLEELKNLIAEEHREIVVKDFNNHISGKTLYYNSKVKVNFNGMRDKWVFIRGKALRDREGKAIKMSGSITDISYQKESEEKINSLVFYDALTGIPNSKLFANTLETTLMKSKDTDIKHAILYLDLDNFKETNDTLGHDYGDKLLKQVAVALKALIKEKDIVSRVSGDEFVILMNDIVDYSEVSKACENILNTLNHKINIDNKHVYTSASIGITIFPEDGTERSILFKNVDTAMYNSKYNGKAKYSFFDTGMSDLVIRRVQIEKGLRKALSNNELEIHYQPQIDIINNRIKGFEALLRWDSYELGSISPGEFIPIAEQSGLIIPIGEWIIRKVFLQNNLWKEKGYVYDTIAINLSAIQVQYEKFGENLKKIMEECDINPQFIELEITESILIKDFKHSIALLNEIKKLGVKIALDDFGTGYSSLSYLKKLPINTLKVDKSFIDNITINGRDKDITEGIIQLAQKIDLDVIAEGAETKEQIDLLQAMGCNQIQGYYFSKPLPASEIEENFLKNNWMDADK